MHIRMLCNTKKYLQQSRLHTCHVEKASPKTMNSIVRAFFYIWARTTVVKMIENIEKHDEN